MLVSTQRMSRHRRQLSLCIPFQSFSVVWLWHRGLCVFSTKVQRPRKRLPPVLLLILSLLMTLLLIGKALNFFDKQTFHIPTLEIIQKSSLFETLPRNAEQIYRKRPGVPKRDQDSDRKLSTATYDSTCNNPPPRKSNYGLRPHFPTMKSVIEEAYEDAITLASQAAGIDASSLAWVISSAF